VTCRKGYTTNRTNGVAVPGFTVHVRLTTEWALEEGFSRADARAIARADIEVDALWPGSKKWGRHFNPMASAVFGPLEMRRAVAAVRAGERERALVHLGRSLHSRQDAIGHGRLGLNHLLLRLGLRRNPDEWPTMSPSVQERIERATRRALRVFAVAAGSSPVKPASR
jgi:hypothetical protein